MHRLNSNINDVEVKVVSAEDLDKKLLRDLVKLKDNGVVDVNVVPNVAVLYENMIYVSLSTGDKFHLTKSIECYSPWLNHIIMDGVLLTTADKSSNIDELKVEIEKIKGEL